jgi:hypothetical protein
MENKKIYFNSARYGYGMIDETQNLVRHNFNFNYYTKYKPCTLQFYDRQIVPKEDESNDKAYQYMYRYKITPLQGRFRKIPSHKPFIHDCELIDQYVVCYKDY